VIDYNLYHIHFIDGVNGGYAMTAKATEGHVENKKSY
jgi:hypothetical protein